MCATISTADIPAPLRPIIHFVKIANDYLNKDVVIYYWCLLKALEDGMKLSGSDPNAKKMLILLMTELEKVKQANKEKDAIMQEVVAQAHIEDQAQKLFKYAEQQDSQAHFHQNMIKSFYTAAYLFDVLTCFGQLDDNIQSARKYAKWRATHIHSCLKRGEQPTPGNQQQQKDHQADSDDIAAQINDELSAELNALNASMNGPPPQSQQPYFAHQPQQPQVPSSTHFPSYGQPAGGIGGAPRPGIQEPFRQGMPGPGSNQQNQPQQPGASFQAGYSMPPQTQQPPAGNRAPAGAEIVAPAAQPAPGLTLEDYLEAKKLTKYAASALDYEDPKTAIEYMHQAIALLEKKGGGRAGQKI